MLRLTNNLSKVYKVTFKGKQCFRKKSTNIFNLKHYFYTILYVECIKILKALTVFKCLLGKCSSLWKFSGLLDHLRKFQVFVLEKF